MKKGFQILPLRKPLRKKHILPNNNVMIESWEIREEFLLAQELRTVRLTNDTGPR